MPLKKKRRKLPCITLWKETDSAKNWNDFEGALEEYKKAETLNPELPTLHFHMGGIY